MSLPWVMRIKDTKQLTVYPTLRLRQSRWGGVFEPAVNKFNELSAKHKLVVTLKADLDHPPDTEENKEGGANIKFDYSGSNPIARYDGKDHAFNDAEKGRHFDATGLHGATVSMGIGGIVKSHIFLPMYPLATNDREVGDHIKLFIAVHELIHAAGGLSDSEHSPANNPDWFVGWMASQPVLHIGQTPDQDIVHLPGQLKKSLFMLSSRTAGLIQSNWS